jgi:lactate racemase
LSEIKLPYGRDFLYLKLEDKLINKVLRSKDFNVKEQVSTIVRQALENPFSSQRLSDIAEKRTRMLLITSDHTRPMPSRITVPLIIEEAISKNPDLEIIIMIATGLHRDPTERELIERFGEEIISRYSIIPHEARDKSKLIKLGVMSTGNELWLNSIVKDVDLIVAEGFIEPHFVAGYSGGRKSILPGIAGYETIMINHSPENIDHPNARNGILEGNPLHIEMCEAAEMSNLEFILNVVLDRDKRIVAGFSGSFKVAHQEGYSFLERYCQVEPAMADIVIVSNDGFPLDLNVYQGVKGMSVAAATCNEGGVIILVAECRDGIAHKNFYDMMISGKSPEEVLEKIRNHYFDMIDQWQSQYLAKILSRNSVIIVSDNLNREQIEKAHLKVAPDLDTALNMAYEIIGARSPVTVIPDGPRVIIK